MSIATVSFARAGAGLLTIASPGAVSSSVRGYGSGDVIDLDKLTASSLAYTDNTLTLYGSRGNVLDTLHVEGRYSQSDFALASDGHGRGPT